MEQLLFFLVFALIGIAQFLYRLFRARAQRSQEERQRQRRAPTPVAEPRPSRDEVRHDEWDEEREWEKGQRRQAAERQRREAARRALPPGVVRIEQGPASLPGPRAAAPAPPVRRPAVPPRRLASHTELRRAIVLMEILGPCRGVTPMTPPRVD